jgi:hypothetical protein
MSTSNSAQWMIRTANLVLSGPFPEEEIKQRLTQGVIHASDEICPSGGYWFSVQDREETRNRLGVEFVLRKASVKGVKGIHETEEATETETDIQELTEEEVTDSEIVAPAQVSLSKSKNPGRAPVLSSVTHPESSIVGRLLFVVLLVFVGTLLILIRKILKSAS